MSKFVYIVIINLLMFTIGTAIAFADVALSVDMPTACQTGRQIEVAFKGDLKINFLGISSVLHEDIRHVIMIHQKHGGSSQMWLGADFMGPFGVGFEHEAGTTHLGETTVLIRGLHGHYNYLRVQATPNSDVNATVAISFGRQQNAPIYTYFGQNGWNNVEHKGCHILASEAKAQIAATGGSLQYVFQLRNNSTWKIVRDSEYLYSGTVYMMYVILPPGQRYASYGVVCR